MDRARWGAVGHEPGGASRGRNVEGVGYASGWDMRRNRVLESREGSAHQRQEWPHRKVPERQRPHRKVPQHEVERHAVQGELHTKT